MNLKKEVYKLIPPDYLHWSEIDQKFTLFSQEEYTKMIENCLWAGAEKDQVIVFIREMEKARRAELLLKRLFSGDVKISFDETGEICWAPVNHD